MRNARRLWTGGVASLAVAVVALTAISQRLHGAAGEFAVWAVHDGEKIKRDDRQNANKARNAVWDGTRIKLVAARNEIVAFQVMSKVAPPASSGCPRRCHR